MADYLANGSTGSTTERKVRAFIDLHSYGQLCTCTADVFSQSNPSLLLSTAGKRRLQADRAI